MNKNKIVLTVALVAGLIGGSFAQEATEKAPLSPSERAAERIAKAGGEIIKKGTFLGKVSIVNEQSKLSTADCEAVAKLIAEATQLNIVVDDGKDAAVKLTIIDDPTAPTLLLATEDHWGKMNVAKLVDDLPGANAKAKFFAPRGRKMLLKGLSILLGGGASQFPGNVMNTTTIRQLDMVQESLPIDMTDVYKEYLKPLGVTPAEKVTYRKACKEGWAPAPTNEVQQAIWDKYHEIPTQGIEIKFDSKKGK